MIDVKSRRCAAEGCNKYPAFNTPGENTARFCGDHRQQGMIDVHNKRCAFEGCQKRPTFNYVGVPHLPGRHHSSLDPCKQREFLSQHMPTCDLQEPKMIVGILLAAKA